MTETEPKYLPPELYAEILEYLKLHWQFPVPHAQSWHREAERLSQTLPEWKQMLSQFALSSKYHRSIVLPLQFSSVCFFGVCFIGGDNFKLIFNAHWPNTPKNVSFCRMLNKGDKRALELAKYVKQCGFFDWGWFARSRFTDPRGSEQEKCLLECLRALPAMRNLKTLYFPAYLASIDDAIKGIGKLKRLKALFMDGNSAWKTPPGQDVLRSLGAIRLEHLRCSSGHPQTITCRYLRTRNIQSLETENWSFMKHIMSLRPPIQLTELKIHCINYDIRKLWHYLVLTPSLTHLTLNHTADVDGAAIESLTHPSSPFLPNLQYLQAPLYFSIPFARVHMKKLVIPSYHSPYVVVYWKTRLTGVVFPFVEELQTEPSTSLSRFPASILESFPEVQKRYVGWDERKDKEGGKECTIGDLELANS